MLLQQPTRWMQHAVKGIPAQTTTQPAKNFKITDGEASVKSPSLKHK